LVSESGDVKRKVPGKTRTNTQHKGTVYKNGYLRYKLVNDEGKKTLVFAHHLVLWTFVGLRPSPSLEGAHNDGVSANNHYTNLRWDTRKGNHADLQTHGTAVKGVRNGRAKLTEDQVKAIRLEYDTLVASGKKYGAKTYLCDKFKIGPTAFDDIISRRHWSNIQ
jgi:hypothetical protein